MKKHSGFTLVELMVALIVAGILFGYAVPAFRGLMQNNRITAQTNELVTALNLTRSESVKRGSTVSICASADGATCGGNWQQGWIVFTDIGNDGTVTAGVDQILRVWEALGGDTTIAATATAGGAITDLRYDRLGAANLSGTFALDIPDCTGDERRNVNVATSGKVSTTRTACS